MNETNQNRQNIISITSIIISGGEAAAAARRQPPPRYAVGASCAASRVDGLRVVRGKPYCLRHRGDCDHAVTIRGVRLAHADDEPQRPRPDSTRASRGGERYEKVLSGGTGSRGSARCRHGCAARSCSWI